MSNETKVQPRGTGIGFMGALALILITLKLTGVINWSWWMVTAPLWGGLAFVAGLVVVLSALYALALIADRVYTKLKG
jgi:hypothetical protein